MIYWLFYDISQNRNRVRVANLCKDYGLQRAQKSAFLGNLTRNKAEMLALEIQKCINSASDKVFLAPAGKEDFAKKIVFGYFDETATSKPSVIFIE